MKENHFLKFVDDTPLIVFPGAMGTELQRRGYKTSLPLWSAAANTDVPELVAQIHKDYFDVGADIAVTNTFRTTPRTYKKIDKNTIDAHEALKRSVEAARKSSAHIKDRQVFVAGSIAPLEDCYEPDLVPNDNELAEEHGQLSQWMKDENVDFLLLETINAKREANAMVKAARQTGLPFIISFVVNEDGGLLDGTPLKEAIASTDAPERAAIMLNCRPLDTLTPAFKELSAAYKGAKGIYANGIGRPHPDQGWIFEENQDSIDKYVEAATVWKNQGAKIIGGCCGTTPSYIRALKEKFS